MIISTILPIILNENIEKMSIVCQREDNLMLFKVKIFLMKSIMCLRNLLENITESLEDSNPIFNDIKKRLILLGAFY